MKKLIPLLNLLLIALTGIAQQPVKILYGNDTLYVHPTDNHAGIVWRYAANYSQVNTTNDGKANTDTIVKIYGNVPGRVYAARVCDTLDAFGYTDWFLPSKTEFIPIYQNKSSIGNLSVNYWTSNNGQVFNTGSGNSSGYDIGSAFTVRCIKISKGPEPMPTTANFNTTIIPSTKTVTFKDSSTSATQTFWQLGNATVSTDLNPIVTYKQGGYYRVTQSVLDTTTNTIAQTEKIMQINDGTNDCEADFTYSVNTTNKSVAFTNTSLGINLTNYVWDFGDKQTSTTASPTYTFFADNFYSVCLSVVNATCKNISCKTIKTGTATTKENAAFIFVPDKNTKKVYFNDKSTAATKWLWNFGDGNSSTSQHPQHIYADTGLFHVTLEINSATDASQVFSALVNVHSNINSLRATYISKEKTTPTKGVIPIEFKGVGYGDASEVEWNFGDGTKSSTSMSPIHEYAQSGKYNVCMTVYDSLAYQTFTYCDTIEIGLVGINHSSLTINNSDFDMYPNPAKQSLVVSIKSLVNTNTEDRITITNTLGQIVFTNYYLLTTNYSINVSQFVNGMYFVRVGNTMKKLIVNK